MHALGLDSETSGFGVFGVGDKKDRVRLIQIGDANAGWAFARDDWLGLLKDVVEKWDGDWILHNATFDALFFDVDCGVHIPRQKIRDTMVRSRINEPHMSMALKQQAARHIDPAAAGLQAELAGTKWTWANVPIDYAPYWTYGALDPVLTYRLEEFHKPITDAEAPDAFELEMAVLWVVEKMRRYGAHVDRPGARQKLVQFNEYVKSVERWCQDEYGVKPGSNAAIISILEDAGFEFTATTKSGAIALDKEVLEGIDHPLAQAVLGRRQAQKMASTYLRFYTEEADYDDLLHPSFNTLGAKTGRMSCSDPNLQNLPRLGTSRTGDSVRNCFTSRYIDPDLLPQFDEKFTVEDAMKHGSLIMCDYSQIEMRMLAHFAQEEGMIKAFQSDGDFFVNLARQIYQDDTITKKDKRRQVTKNAGYAKIYFAGLAKFAATAGITTVAAKDFLNRFDTMYPGVSQFQNGILQTAMNRKMTEGLAYARSPLTGRKYVADDRAEYKLINYLIQGCAAEVNKMKLVELDNAGIGDYMYATIHDEVLLDAPPGMAVDIVNTLEAIMNDDKMFAPLPIEAEASFAHRWGMKKDWVHA